MGTRAAFFIGDPRDLENREWLGCIAWDGYPEGECQSLAEAKTAEEFRTLVMAIAKVRDDFAHPDKGGWPFPWIDDLFLTDCTYWFASGAVQYAGFHYNWGPLKEYLALTEGELEQAEDRFDNLPNNVPAPSDTWDRSQPDSIMIVSTK